MTTALMRVRLQPLVYSTVRCLSVDVDARPPPQPRQLLFELLQLPDAARVLLRTQLAGDQLESKATACLARCRVSPVLGDTLCRTSSNTGCRTKSFICPPCRL
eukprot:1728801-Rhodomonas_salina.2